MWTVDGGVFPVVVLVCVRFSPQIGMTRVDLKLIATDTALIRAGKANPDGLLELECGAPLVVRFAILNNFKAKPAVLCRVEGRKL